MTIVAMLTGLTIGYILHLWIGTARTRRTRTMLTIAATVTALLVSTVAHMVRQ